MSRHLAHAPREWLGSSLKHPSAFLIVLLLLVAGSWVGATAPAWAASVDPLLAQYAQAGRSGSAVAMEGLAGVLPPLPGGVEEAGGQGWVDVLVRGSIASEVIEGLGGRVGSVAGEVKTVRMPLAGLSGLIAAAGVEELSLGQAVELQSDLSMVEIGALEAWGGVPPYFPEGGETGRGVIVGVVDTGLDVGYADLRTATGTRVLWLWDQEYGQAALPPTGYAYGSEYSGSAINAGQYPGRDVDGHGTHVTGVAVGNGRATGNGVRQYTYMGVAPEADLVVVKLVKNSNGVVTDDKIVDGVSYVFQKAGALQRPAVVLLAVGKMTGPHDGQDPLDLALTSLSGPGKIVVAAAGNYGNTGRHGEWTSTASNQTGDVTLTVGTYTPGPTAAEHFYSEAWYNATGNYTVSVVTPTGEVIGPVARGSETTVNSASGVVKISNGKYMSGNGSYRVNLYVYRGSTTYPTVRSGTWTYRFKSQVSGTRRVDVWLTDFAMGTATPAFVLGKTEARLVCSPATANGVIAVGAYSTKREWTDASGYQRAYANAVLNDLAGFSGAGPRRDEVVIPHVAAPGYGVGAAMSSHVTTSSAYILPDGKHKISYGTSVAAAHVSGVVAMQLENDATLTTAAAIARLQGSATADSWTGMVPNPRWGAGKLHVPGATVAVGPGTARFAFAAPFPNPTTGPTSFRFSLVADDFADGVPSVSLRILDVRGREVARIAAPASVGQHSLGWDGRTAGGQRAAAGVYLAHLDVGRREAIRKFVLVH